MAVSQIFSVGDLVRIKNKLNEISAAISGGSAPTATTPTATQNKRLATTEAADDIVTALAGIAAAESARVISNAYDIANATVTLDSNTLTYDGTQKTKTVVSVVADGVTLTEGTDYIVMGNTGTNAGTYTLQIVSLSNSYSGTNEQTWTIAKAAGSVSLSESSLEFDTAGTTEDIIVTRPGDGAVTASSSDTGVCTVSVSGTTITVTAVAEGTATITINVGAGTNYTGTSATCGVTFESNYYASLLSGNIGDEVTVPWTSTSGVTYQSVWCIADKRTVELEDGTTKQGVVLQSKYAFPDTIQFDAPEPSHSNSNVQNYGLNSWEKSGIRQWLNSDAEKGNWWTAQSNTDVAPNQHTTLDGFMRGLDETFKNSVAKVKIVTSKNTVTEGGGTSVTYDKFWLPSTTEVYGDSNSNEGPYFAYWKNKTGTSSPSTGSNNGRIIYDLSAQSIARWCRLRSAYLSDASYVRVVDSGGIMLSNYADGASRVAPACVIC